jgi:ferredoxin
MKYFRLSAGYKELIDSLLKTGFRVVAPVVVNNVSMFRQISSAEEALQPDMYLNTVRSAKQHFFPATEPIVKFAYQGKDIKVADVDETAEETVIIGLRPCDAAAFSTIDLIFNYEYKDKFYIQRRQKATLVTVACEQADEACFCTSFGLAPDSAEGSDILLKKDADGKWFAAVNSEKGDKLVERINNFNPDEKEIISGDVYNKVKEKIRPSLDTEKIKNWLDNNFNSDFWDEYSSRCLGCASCAFLCPACHCFDIVDEMHYDKGVRRKNWDACQFPVFTLHSSGHNPREAQAKRYRQRVMHKFNYYPERFNKNLCTGCGRCVRACPVNLDIYEVVSSAVKE